MVARLLWATAPKRRRWRMQRGVVGAAVEMARRSKAHSHFGNRKRAAPKRRRWRMQRGAVGAAVEIVRRSKPKTISGTARVPWAHLLRETEYARIRRNDGIGRRAGLKIRFSKSRAKRRNPLYFGVLTNGISPKNSQCPPKCPPISRRAFFEKNHN